MNRLIANIWKVVGSSHTANIIAFISLIVTVFLTWYIFSYTTKLNESHVFLHFNFSTDDQYDYENIDTYIKRGDGIWSFYLVLYNSGPADMLTGNFYFDIKDSEDITLIGLDHRDMVQSIKHPFWPLKLTIPDKTIFKQYLLPINNLEHGDNYAIRLVFSVKEKLNKELTELWKQSGFKKVQGPIKGRYHYDTADVDKKAFNNFIEYFIHNINLTGQNVRLERAISKN